ncbi:MAG TPA: hypothetical protein VD928_03365 [Candidatus Paceibacterota bacterium]|nr:hypothetical protein [Candidatus Paceibacterota bacterium]
MKMTPEFQEYYDRAIEEIIAAQKLQGHRPSVAASLIELLNQIAAQEASYGEPDGRRTMQYTARLTERGVRTATASELVNLVINLEAEP